MIKKTGVLAVLLLVSSGSVFSQDSRKEFTQDLVFAEGEEDLLIEADYLFDQGNYLAALPNYVNLFQRYPGTADYIFRAGICYLYKTDEVHKAVELLEEVLEVRPKTPQLAYYLGRAYHLNNLFNDAAVFYKKALKEKKTPKDRKKLIERYIENCNNGKKAIVTPVDVKIENIGPPVNTTGSEYVPVISSDESVLMYTYKGERSTGGAQNEYGEPDPKGRYYEDILISYKLGDAWLESESLGENINTPGHDACIALSADGQKLFIYKDTDEGSGDIFISELDSNIWTMPLRMNSNINTGYWEGSASLSSDEKKLYFSSERPKGLGGKDIYVSTKRDDGIWGEAVNIGSGINTPYNDDAPFIHPDGKTLYFSSDGHNSMGGYDLFMTTLQVDGQWSKPKNLGYPINTSGDELFYVVSANGERGYFSSGRAGGVGQQDIYIIELGKTAKEHAVFLLKGKVTANDNPVEAQIEVTYTGTTEPKNLLGEKQGSYNSNAASGNYLVNLPTGNDYNVTYDVIGFPSHTEKIVATKIDSFMEMIVDVRLYSDNYTTQLNLEGNVLYSELPLRPVADVTIYIRSKKDGSLLMEATTDKKGYFSFINLPPLEHYMISLDAKDPDLNAYTNPIITGYAMSGDKPAKGLPINDVTTEPDGSFRLEIEGEGFIITQLPSDKTSLDTVDFSDPEIYQEVLDRYGSISAKDLIFKIQIGAYLKPENFDYSNITDLGEVDIQLLEDGITRFTMGEFKTLIYAELFQQKLIRRGVHDAFILIFYKGERRLLADVISNGFFALGK